MKPVLVDDFRKEPPYPPDYLFPGERWSGVGDLEDLRGLERRLSRESLIELSYRRLHHRLGFALLTMDMQHRWRSAYQAALRRNNRALETVARLADALPDERLVLLGGAAMLCSVHEDPGTAPLEAAALLAAPAAATRVAARLQEWGFHRDTETEGRFRLPDPDGGADACVLRIETRLAWEGAALDAAGVIARARPPAPAPPEERPARPELVPPVGDAEMDPNPEVEFIPAVEIATPTAGGAARPAIMRPVPKPERKSLEQVLERPGIAVPSPADALLYGALDWLTGRRDHGLARWELAERIRAGGVPWDELANEARRLGLAAVAHHALAILAAEWRAPVPPEALARLRPGPLLRGALAIGRGHPRWRRRILLMNHRPPR